MFASRIGPFFSTSAESSRFSRTTTSSDGFSDVIPENLSFEDLNTAVEALGENCRLLELENQIFQDYLEASNSDLLIGMEEVLRAMTEAMKKLEGFAMADQVERTHVPGVPDTKKDSDASEAEKSADSTSPKPSIPPDEDASEKPSITSAQKPSETATKKASEVVTKKVSEIAAKKPPEPAPETTAEGEAMSKQIAEEIAKAMGMSSGSIPRPGASGGGSDSGNLRASSVLRRRMALAFERCPRMNYTQRLDIAVWATQKADKQLRDAIKKEMQTGGLLRARIEAQGLRLTEIKNLIFRLNAQYRGKDFIIPEKLIKDIRDTMMYCDSVVENIRLKSATMLRHRKRVLADLAVKKALSESLRPVDIENLKIENNQLLRTIDLKTEHLHELKSVSGHATQRVNTNKKRLLELSKKVEVLRKEVQVKQSHIGSMEQEERTVIDEAQKADRILNQVRERMVKFTAPDVFEYVVQKRELRELRKQVSARKKLITFQVATSMQLQTQLRLSKGSVSDGPRKSDGSRRKSTDPTSIASFLSASRDARPVRKTYAPDKNIGALCMRKPSTTSGDECQASESLQSVLRGRDSAQSE